MKNRSPFGKLLWKDSFGKQNLDWQHYDAGAEGTNCWYKKWGVDKSLKSLLAMAAVGSLERKQGKGFEQHRSLVSA